MTEDLEPRQVTVREWFRLQRRQMLERGGMGTSIEELVTKALNGAVTPIESLGPRHRILFDPREVALEEKTQMVQQLIDLAMEDIERDLQRIRAREYGSWKAITR